MLFVLLFKVAQTVEPVDEITKRDNRSECFQLVRGAFVLLLVLFVTFDSVKKYRKI